MYPCPCCGYNTLISLDPHDCICRVCWWHNDGQDGAEADSVWGGPNSNLSLTQARINFLRHGISNPERKDLFDKRDPPSAFDRGRVFEIEGEKIVERDTTTVATKPKAAGTEIRFRHWTLLVDAESTRAAYASVPQGGCEDCGCDYCLNFAAARKRVYPKEVRHLFDQLGIDWRKEEEVYEMGKDDKGLRLYGGWFHFMGTVKENHTEVTERPGETSHEKVTELFEIGFHTDYAPEHDVFKGKRLPQVTFHAYVPWVIEKPEPE